MVGFYLLTIILSSFTWLKNNSHHDFHYENFLIRGNLEEVLIGGFGMGKFKQQEAF